MTSEKLQIPSAVVIWESDMITGVIENEPRIEGPFQARLDVRITGKSTISHRQLS